MMFGNNLQVLLIVLGLAAFAVSVPTFTGFAKEDFAALTGEDLVLYHNFHDSHYPNPTPYMVAHNQTSGMDIIGTHFYYDYTQDTVYMGIECSGICGDSDGDGNPGATDPNNPDAGAGQDPPDMCGYEGFAIMLWNDVPTDYEVSSSDPQFFFPNTVVGKQFAGCIVDNGVSRWKAYEWPNFRDCEWDYVKENPMADCVYETEGIISNPCALGLSGGFRTANDLTNPSQPYLAKGVLAPQMFSVEINASNPSIEYTLNKFSKYPGFPEDYRIGTDLFRILAATYSGNPADPVGEDYTYPSIWQIEFDCAHVPGGDWTYDECGVCGGDGSSCWDCDHVSNGNSKYDECGVCNGNNQTCWDCEHIPNGDAKYDACGVCNGNNQTCWDCAHIPNGNAKYDSCGVCDGNNSTCWDCAHIPNGNAQYDACGVCDGNNSTCLDCFHIPNGPAKYDRFGICGGDGVGDCFDNPYGNATYDNCGVCGGHDETCTCFGYLGYKEPYLCYALLRWTIAASRVKITDTLDVLYAIKSELPYYDYKSDALQLNEYVDTIHNFCDNCLDQFDFAQVWFADRLAGNCIGAKCETIAKEDFSWSL